MSRLIGWRGCGNCQAMHRRAQAAESAAAKVVRQHDPRRLWATVASLRWQSQAGWRRARHWRKQYDRIKAATPVQGQDKDT